MLASSLANWVPKEQDGFFGDPAFEAAHGGQRIYPWRAEEEASQADFQDLVEACEEEEKAAPRPPVSAEALSTSRHRRKVRRVPRHRAIRLVDQIMEYGEDGHTRDFRQRLAALLDEHGVEAPSVTVEYRDVTIEVDAHTTAGSLPNLDSILWQFVKGLVGLGKTGTRRVRVLSNLHGKLKPRRITLLQGPPGSGKTLFMQALAGRLVETRHLRMTGDITWNGRHADEVVLQRSAALVDQNDNHIPMLTVRETLEFANICQEGHRPGFNPVEEITEAKHKNKELAMKVARLSRDWSSALSQSLGSSGTLQYKITELEQNKFAEVRDRWQERTLPNNEELKQDATLGAKPIRPIGPTTGPTNPGVPPRPPPTSPPTGPTNPGVPPRTRPLAGVSRMDTIASGVEQDVALSPGSLIRRTSSGGSAGTGPVRPSPFGSHAAQGEIAHDDADLASPSRPVKRTFSNKRESTVDEERVMYSPMATSRSARSDEGADDDGHFMALLRNIYGSGVRLEFVLRVMGLTQCQDTVVGSALLRGISGGERKRVTTGEALVGGKKLLLMDEISTGLDSAMTYQVIKDLANAAHYNAATILVSLLQPPPEVFRLFDDVILLAEGQLLYHGPQEEILNFFASLGFECPIRKDPATFLQEVTTPQGQMALASDQLRRHLGLNRQPGAEEYYSKNLMVPLSDITAAFWSCKWGAEMRRELDEAPFDRSRGARALTLENFALRWWEAFDVVAKRQWLLLIRDKSLIYGRMIQSVIMSLIIGSLFHGLRPTPNDGRTFFSVIFLSMFFLAMGAAPELSVTFGMKSVFYKQRDNHFFQSSVFSVVLAVIRAPFLIAEALIFSCITYFWIGFSPRAAEFFVYYLINFLTMLAMGSIYRCLAACCNNYDVANSLSGLILLVLVVSSGFTIIYASIPPYWIWGYWISPFSYSIRAAVVNEMTSPHWSVQDPAAPPGQTLGISALKSFSFQTERHWIWAGIVYNIGFIVLLTLGSALGFAFMKPPKRKAVAGPEKPQVPFNPPKEIGPKVSLRDMSMQVAQTTNDTSQLPTSKRSLDVSALHGVSPYSPGISRRSMDVEMGNHPGDPPPLPNGVQNPKNPGSEGLPFLPVTLVYRHLRYFVPLPAAMKKNAAGKGEEKMKRLELLKDISGFAAPGVLTALMGGSGAGKTTLMDVIAGRKTVGEITGDILVNGYPKEQRTWARVVGYVEQSDIHTAQITVRESLMFSARLRLPSEVSLEAARNFVDDAMRMVELEPIQDRLVGVPGTGLSVEQRKRLTIAVELVANPSVLFMDEPTSGLDARAASIVMRSVKNVSMNGRTIMVTIHQPSTEIFESFDALVLMQRGGKLIYFGMLGVESCDLISYLEGVPGVVPIGPGENPATWMLEVTGGTAITGRSKAAGLDFSEYYRASGLCAENEATGAELARAGKEASAPLHFESAHAATFWMQNAQLFYKFWLAYWRSPSYNLSRMVLTLLLCLFYGSLYFHKGRLPATGADIGNVQNVIGVIYSSVSFQGMFNLMTSLPVISNERAVLYRERAASMYGTLPYVTAAGLVEMPYILAQTTVFVPIVYFMIGFRQNAVSFFVYYVTFFLSTSMFTFFGQLLVFVTPSMSLAAILAGAVNTVWSIFNGFMLPFPQFPAGWRWLNRLSPTTWVIYTLVADQLGTDQTMMTTPTGAVTTVAEFVQSYFGYDYHFRWYAMLFVFIFVIGFRILATAAVRYINWQRR